MASTARDIESLRRRYPLAYAAGFSGTKSEMRSQVNAIIREELRAASPPPPRSKWFKPHHQGHSVTAPIMRTSEPHKAGSWIQFCTNQFASVQCGRPKVLKAPLDLTHATQPPFASLYAVRQELSPIPAGRQPPRNIDEPLAPKTSASSTAIVSRASSPPQPASSSPISSPTFPRWSSPPLAATSSVPTSPASSVIDLTLEDSGVENQPANVVVKFWVKNLDKPVKVRLECESSLLTLDKNKEFLGRFEVEKCPMQRYLRGRKRWVDITWAGPIKLEGSGELWLREKGMEVTID
ncbi:hypothetical protein V5O48_016735 [Marasmius crinis-equi]|uniref:Uncharacterized protein n=1 Tax=Marasmius crinis-equi TaxID=585013 RepID=A0ABR3EQX8_9AGAR